MFEFLDPSYIPVAFHFRVNIGALPNPMDTAFQEISGMKYRMEVEPIFEGGENRFVHQLPTGVKQENLVLKRAQASITSPLVLWCKAVLEGGLNIPITPFAVSVGLFNGDRSMVRCWMFHNAFPISWELETLNSTKNEVAIESIEFAYQNMERML